MVVDRGPQNIGETAGEGKEDRRPAGISRVQEARRNLRRAIRQAKLGLLERFLQEGNGNDVWIATQYTSPRIDKVGQSLVDEDGDVAEGHHDREQPLLAAHFPKAPPNNYEPIEGGTAYERVNPEGILLSKAASPSAPGDDRISAGIIKVGPAADGPDCMVVHPARPPP